jgi:hypothetical protein
MLLYKYLPDCCDQCCDCERPDPTKDKVIIRVPLAAKEKAAAKEAELWDSNDPIKPQKMDEPVSIPTKLQPIIEEERDLPFEEARHCARELEEASQILEQVALIERRTKEAEELKKVQEIADAIEAQDVAEAEELLEAQEASLLPHQTKLQQKSKTEDNQKAQRQNSSKSLDRCNSRQEEERKDQEKVTTFLKANGFADLDTKRSRMFKSSYPLHCAVSNKNAEMVQLLLAAGARPTLKNSAGLSPLQLAQKLDKKDSHKEIIQLLDFGKR